MDPFLIFLISIGLNVIFRLLTPYIGLFRRGIDTIVFCAIATGYVGGVAAGIFYGALIAISYYMMRSRNPDNWKHIIYVMPLSAFIGALASMFNYLPFLYLGMILFLVYHAVSFTFTALLFRQVGFRYIIFMTFNFLTTYFLLRLAVLYLI